MKPKKLTILFTPLDGWGHINASHGLAEELRARGHRVVFAVDSAFKGKLTPYGFEEEIHSIHTTDAQHREGTDSNVWADIIVRHQHVFRLSPLEIVGQFVVNAFDMMFAGLKARDGQYREIIRRVKPDVIVIDSYIGSPTLTNSGVPWVWLYSAAPHLCLNSPAIPPGWSGLPLNASKGKWFEFRVKFNALFDNLLNRINKWYKAVNAPELDSNTRAFLHPVSDYLNVYLYPKELDYKEVQPLAHNWHRVDGFVRTTHDTFEIPECLRERSGKLVFLSMGSFGSSNIELMTRLTTILAKSEHRFIVAKGPLHDKYELPDNMWGQGFVPQTAVLPLVDLVLTHGGNNTVTETFFYGKPMLVLPLFGDQFDNGQRLQETGLGLRLNPFHCTEEELLTSIDKLVNDSDLAQRMKSIGDRIREQRQRSYCKSY